MKSGRGCISVAINTSLPSRARGTAGLGAGGRGMVTTPTTGIWGLGSFRVWSMGVATWLVLVPIVLDCVFCEGELCDGGRGGGVSLG